MEILARRRPEGANHLSLGARSPHDYQAREGFRSGKSDIGITQRERVTRREGLLLGQLRANGLAELVN